MTLFVDTSGLIALIDADDPAHQATIRAFENGLEQRLVTHAYVVIETLAVVRRRFGAIAATRLMDEVLPAIDVSPVDQDLHSQAMTAFRDAVASSVSLVDRTSFLFMRREGLESAISLDGDFRTAGFLIRP